MRSTTKIKFPKKVDKQSNIVADKDEEYDSYSVQEIFAIVTTYLDDALEILAAIQSEKVTAFTSEQVRQLKQLKQYKSDLEDFAKEFSDSEHENDLEFLKAFENFLKETIAHIQNINVPNEYPVPKKYADNSLSATENLKKLNSKIDKIGSRVLTLLTGLLSYVKSVFEEETKHFKAQILHEVYSYISSRSTGTLRSKFRDKKLTEMKLNIAESFKDSIISSDANSLENVKDMKQGMVMLNLIIEELYKEYKSKNPRDAVVKMFNEMDRREIQKTLAAIIKNWNTIKLKKKPEQFGTRFKDVTTDANWELVNAINLKLHDMDERDISVGAGKIYSLFTSSGLNKTAKKIDKLISEQEASTQKLKAGK